ncbi:MAG: hypothetical protein JXX14_22275 [Deltaproteobacteria bacterium]|nr:hypothetical protein [Deltaproteobacteria bacterium]
METQKILDIAHVSFLDIIRASIVQLGAAATKGMLIRNAMATAEKIPEVSFDTLDEFVASIDIAGNPVTQVEGKAVHYGKGLFGLPSCPFAPSIGDYKSVYGGLPEDYHKITEDYNKQGPVTGALKVGHGAGVSPFCAVHQPLRGALKDRIRIGGNPISILQLGCKSGSGEKGLAQQWIDETDFTAAEVEKVLDDNMCCYAIKVEA